MTNKQTEQRYVYDVNATIVYSELTSEEKFPRQFEGYFYNQEFAMLISNGEVIEISGFKWMVRGRMGVIHCAKKADLSPYSLLDVVCDIRNEATYLDRMDFLKKNEYSYSSFREAHKKMTNKQIKQENN